MNFLTQTDHGVTLQIVLAPRSSRLQFVGIHDGRLKIALTSPPVEGKANEQLLTFLSKQFGVRRRDLSIVSGEKSRKKTILLQGVAIKAVEATLESFLAGD